jgi:hypothetical protein
MNVMPPNIRTHGNRLVSDFHGVDQHENIVLYTVVVRCQEVTGTGIGAGFRVGGGGLT